jgi:hypothetical protein
MEKTGAPGAPVLMFGLDRLATHSLSRYSFLLLTGDPEKE